MGILIVFVRAFNNKDILKLFTSITNVEGFNIFTIQLFTLINVTNDKEFDYSKIDPSLFVHMSKFITEQQSYSVLYKILGNMIFTQGYTVSDEREKFKNDIVIKFLDNNKYEELYLFAGCPETEVNNYIYNMKILNKGMITFFLKKRNDVFSYRRCYTKFESEDVESFINDFINKIVL